MEAIGINLGYVIVQFFSFLIMFLVLRAWVFNPVANMIENRRKTLAKGLEDARVAAEARENAEKEARKIIDEAQEKAALMVREATQRAEKAAVDVRNAADAEAVKIRENALADFDQERGRILAEVRGQVAAISIAAAQKLVGESLDEKRQHLLIEQFFSGVKDGKVVVLAEASLSGGSAEVTSALPLTTAEEQSVKNDVLAKLGSGASVSFHVDPSILGGLIIRVGDKVLDDSVAGRLSALKESIH